jgi:hypothetical protein
MEWTKTKNVYWLKDYPFFNTSIEHLSGGVYEGYHVGLLKFDTLENAKLFIGIRLNQLKFASTYAEISRYITILDSGWPNNIGEGKYIHLFQKDEKYKWITGMRQPWRPTSNEYAIRFPFDTSKIEVENWAVKIWNRHLKRYKFEVEFGF